MPAEVINATERNKLAVPYYVRALALGIPAISWVCKLPDGSGLYVLSLTGTAISVSSISLDT